MNNTPVDTTTAFSARRLRNFLLLVYQTVRYNLKIIFANKFIYFMLSAIGFFLMIVIISLFETDSYPDEISAYYLLIFPGMLLIFYPTAFGIHNDVESRTLELLFGIPNYRYKVWLVRLGIIYLTVYLHLLFLCALSVFAYAPVPVFEMAFQLMFPIFFFGALGFMFSTMIRSGNGTAALMVIIGMLFFFFAEPLEDTRWNLFLNPYHTPQDISDILWVEILFYNRLYLGVGTVLAILAGLLRLQKREGFV